jgi:hypothetical protein
VVIFQFTDFGCIEDVALGLRWSPADFESEVMNRATALAAAKVKLGSTVAVAHSGSARFFADLFAVWTLGSSLKVTPGVQVDQDQFHCLNRA